MKWFCTPLLLLLLSVSNTFAYDCDVDGDGQEGLAGAIHALRVVAGILSEDTPQLCSDGIDNDGDGHVDCADDECSGFACDDGLFCNGTEVCTAGVCTNSTGDPCSGPDGDGDCTETCDESSDSCTANDPNGSSCDDGNAGTTNDTCQSGICEGQQSTCDDLVLNGDETDIDCGGSCSPCTQGSTCLIGDDCHTGHCVDGVCCDTSCDSLCSSCLAANTGGTDGMCAFIPAGMDPEQECPGSETCNGSGICEGQQCDYCCSTTALQCSFNAYCSSEPCVNAGHVTCNVQDCENN